MSEPSLIWANRDDSTDRQKAKDAHVCLHAYITLPACMLAFDWHFLWIIMTSTRLHVEFNTKISAQFDLAKLCSDRPVVDLYWLLMEDTGLWFAYVLLLITEVLFTLLASRPPLHTPFIIKLECPFGQNAQEKGVGGKSEEHGAKLVKLSGGRGFLETFCFYPTVKLFVLNEAKRSWEAFQVGTKICLCVCVFTCACRMEWGFQVKTRQEDGFNSPMLCLYVYIVCVNGYPTLRNYLNKSSKRKSKLTGKLMLNSRLSVLCIIPWYKVLQQCLYLNCLFLICSVWFFLQVSLPKPTYQTMKLIKSSYRKHRRNR